MKSTKYKVNKDNYINVSLADDVASLDEVVISGYSSTTESRRASSLKIKNEDLKNPKADSIQELSGQKTDDISKTNSDEDINNSSNIKIRKNFQETAFFFPRLLTDKDGNVSFNFTAPEALTKWKLQLLAHTKTLNSAVSQFETVTQKELMVIPNAPRFLREGDEIVISTKIANLTEKQLIGKAQLILTDAVTGSDISDSLLTPQLIKVKNLKTLLQMLKATRKYHGHLIFLKVYKP